jgi:hypothetical protein
MVDTEHSVPAPAPAPARREHLYNTEPAGRIWSRRRVMAGDGCRRDTLPGGLGSRVDWTGGLVDTLPGGLGSRVDR